MKISVLRNQIILTKEKTDKLISEIPNDLWLKTPELLNTNMNWQIGHIILANYLHGIASISGTNKEFKELVNLNKYVKFYGPKSKPSNYNEDKPSYKELLNAYNFTLTLTLNNLGKINDNDLESDTEIPNPSVKTKYEALTWLSHHQSWHNGQIAILKRFLFS